VIEILLLTVLIVAMALMGLVAFLAVRDIMGSV
jgi:hypothetical protein